MHRWLFPIHWAMPILWTTGPASQSRSRRWALTLSVSRIWPALLLPYKATELVNRFKEAVKIPIDLHTHYTSGVASMTYLKAVEAGVDIIDTAMSPFALGTSQPATEVMVETFKGLLMIPVLIRTFLQRSRITSVRSVTKLWTAVC